MMLGEHENEPLGTDPRKKIKIIQDPLEIHFLFNFYSFWFLPSNYLGKKKFEYLE